MSKAPARLSVLFVTSELAPLIKTGGLADVSAALPVALAAAGAEVRLLVPGYPAVMEGVRAKSRVASFPALGDMPASQLLAGKHSSGVPMLIVDCPALYGRTGGPYQDASGVDWPDNALRFGLLCYLAAVLASGRSPLPLRPQILHCNDWQSGLAPAYLHFFPGERPRSLLTIHNLAYQGIFPAETVSRLGLPAAAYSPEGVEFYGRMSFLKAGLHYADHLTTVSPTYAAEIQTAEFGFGLEGLLSRRRSHLTGILNGVDVDAWDPETDPYIARYYGVNRLPAKQENKRALQERMGLSVDLDLPLFGVISRFTPQKGLDLVLACARELIAAPAQLAVLGTGDRDLQEAFQQLAKALPGKVAVQIGYDEGLAHQIEAGADLFLMPSRFEPCGLNQMYSQRYGTPPVAHAVGGLADTVVDYSAATLAERSATGFLFQPATAEALQGAITRAVGVWEDTKAFRLIQKAGMARDFSWDASAERYMELYRTMLAS